MATVYRCDRCKTETQNAAGMKTLILPRVNYHKSQFTTENPMSIDLCPACAAEVNEFARMKPAALTTS